jgi:hypothetical protein
MDRTGGQPHPREGFTARRRLRLHGLDDPARHGGPLLGLAVRGRAQPRQTPPHAHRGLARRLGAPPRPPDAEGGSHRVHGYCGPQVALGRVDPPVPRRPHQQVHARRPLLPHQVRDGGFPIPDADEVRLRTVRLGLEDRLHTRQPLLTFCLGHRLALAGGALAKVGGVAGPDRLGPQAQRQAVRHFLGTSNPAPCVKITSMEHLRGQGGAGRIPGESDSL